MTTATSTPTLSDAVTVAADTRLQALDTRVAIFLGADAPAEGDAGLIIGPGETIDIPAGDFRHRTVGAKPGRISYRPWEA